MVNKTRVIQPEGGIYFLKKSPEGLIRITVSKKTLQIVNEEKLNGIPEGWTDQDVAELLDEGRRFFNL